MGQTVEFENYQSRKGDTYSKIKRGDTDYYAYSIKDGKGFRSDGMGGYTELTEEEVKELQKQMSKLFRYGEEDLHRFEYAGTETVDGKEYEVLKTEEE